MSACSLRAFPGAAGPPGISVTAGVEVASRSELEFTYRLGGDLSRRPFARLAVLLGAMARIRLDVQELEAHGSSVVGLVS